MKGGIWVYSQPFGQPVKAHWDQVLILNPVNALVEHVGDDGWLILLDTARQIRYKVWSTVLEA